MKVVIHVLLCCVALASCVPGEIAFKFYVVIKPTEVRKLIAAVTSIAKEDGMETAVAQVTSDTGNVLRVVEGRGHGLRLWVQNMLLSGKEDPELCGVHAEPYSDPAQFLVFTAPRFYNFKSTTTAAAMLGEKVFSQLRVLGFDVRREAAICGGAVIHDRSESTAQLL